MLSSCTIPHRAEVLLNSARLEVQPCSPNVQPSSREEQPDARGVLGRRLLGSNSLLAGGRLLANHLLGRHRRLLDVLLAALAFCFVLLGGLQEAHAAPSGMCSDDAQSIQAPLPLFPADDAVLRGCESEEDIQFSAHAHHAPAERFAPDASPDDLKCVLDVPLPLQGTSRTIRPREDVQDMVTAEFRWQGLRPPCHCNR